MFDLFSEMAPLKCIIATPMEQTLVTIISIALRTFSSVVVSDDILAS